jgi:hypothetical protein
VGGQTEQCGTFCSKLSNGKIVVTLTGKSGVWSRCQEKAVMGILDGAGGALFLKFLKRAFIPLTFKTKCVK